MHLRTNLACINITAEFSSKPQICKVTDRQFRNHHTPKLEHTTTCTLSRNIHPQFWRLYHDKISHPYKHNTQPEQHSTNHSRQTLRFRFRNSLAKHLKYVSPTSLTFPLSFGAFSPSPTKQ